MHRYILTIVLAFFAVAIFAQQRPTPPFFDADAPAWARMLLEEHPNVRAIQAAYREYYDERPFVKNSYTQYYKRWMQWARPYAQMDGSLQFPTIQDLQNEERELLEFHNQSPITNHQSPITNHQSRAATWTFNGPKVHFFPDASAQSVDHTNIYSFDIYAANPSILYAGGEAGGLWKTTDKGINWTLLTANVLHGAFGAVKINPQNPDVVYAGTGGKLIKTTDGGATWTTVYTESNFWANEIYVHEANPNIVICASEKGLLRSVDAGANWTKLWSVNTWTVKPKPNDPNTVWIVRENGAGSDFMISTDGGGSFTASNTGWWQPSGKSANSKSTLIQIPKVH